MGYNTKSKGYKIYLPDTKKMMVSRDVHFLDDQKWDRKMPTNYAETYEDPSLDKDTNGPSVRGTRSMREVYEKCSATICKPTLSENASVDPL